jgi:hypothetical protein
VAAWLGPSSNLTHLAIGCIENYFPPPHMLWRDGDWQLERYAMYEFFNLPYWSRLWVLQEFVLARNLLIMCGNYVIRQHSLKNLTVYGERVGHLPAAEITRIKYSHPRSLSLYSKGRRQYCLASLLESCHDLGCENPLDRIYGLQGLLLDGEKVEVDYNTSCLDLYRKVSSILSSPSAVALDSQFRPISVPQSLDFLSAALNVGHNRSRGSLRPRAVGFATDSLRQEMGISTPWYLNR